MNTLDALSTDVSYALRQLRKFGDIRRAIDALERAEEAIERARSADAEDALLARHLLSFPSA